MEEVLTESDVERGLQTLAALPDAMRAAFKASGGKGEPASVRIVKPWAVRAAAALAEPVSAVSAEVLDGSLPVLRARYRHLASEVRRMGAPDLPMLPAAVVGAAGVVTSAVAATLRAAWPVIARAAVAVGRLVAKHPVKVAVATTTAAALPGFYSAGKNIGTAADKVTASLLPGGGGGIGLAGMSLPVLALLAYLLLKR